jgi:hypothetical protein
MEGISGARLAAVRFAGMDGKGYAVSDYNRNLITFVIDAQALFGEMQKNNSRGYRCSFEHLPPLNLLLLVDPTEGAGGEWMRFSSRLHSHLGIDARTALGWNHH